VHRVFDGRTASARRVESRQAGRLLTTATVSFSLPLAGPEHGRLPSMPDDPESLPRSGPPGPAPSMPLDEIDVRIVDDRSTGEFVRRLWWRVVVPVPDDSLLHDVIAAYVCDVYMIDPALQVHGHSMMARTHRSGTTDSSIWFHRPVRANEWNLLETRSPAAARGRGVITGCLVGADGWIAATVAQEGLIAEREQPPPR
jgi:acyl-CoA thioesterase